MTHHLFNNKKLLILGVIILLLFWIMFVTADHKSNEGSIEYFLHSAVDPLENGLSLMIGFFQKNIKNILEFHHTQGENKKLKKINNYLLTKQLQFDALKSENKRLRKALEFKNTQTHDLIVAEVIAINPTNWSATLTINRGRNLNIKKNMAVIVPEGVIGRINEVRDYSAEVILITDPRQGNIIGGIIARTKALVLISGKGKQNRFCLVQPAGDSHFTDLKKNDLVTTAENSDIFPRGLPIGRVVKLNKRSEKVINQALIKPIANLTKLQHVYIVRMKQDPITRLEEPPKE